MFMQGDLERFLANARGTAAGRKIVTLDNFNKNQLDEGKWELNSLRGRLVELSGQGATATLTAAIGLVVEAQMQNEPVGWIAPSCGTFYPPDVADSGVDLAALVVIRVPQGDFLRGADAIAAARAAERLLRSGAFGLVVIDAGSAARPGDPWKSPKGGRAGTIDLPPHSLAGSAARPGDPWKSPKGGRAGTIDLSHGDLSLQIQGRLVTLAQVHDAAVVCITDKERAAASLGSLISLRAEAMRVRDRDEFAVRVRALKDKRRGPGWEHVAKRGAPPGFT